MVVGGRCREEICCPQIKVTYLLDSDTLIFMMRGLRISRPRNESQRERQKVARRIFERARQAAGEGHRIALSAITVAEVRFGALTSSEPERETDYVDRILTPFALLDFDSRDCASHYARIRCSLETRGQSIGPFDTLIAAHALALSAVMVTNNTGEFARVPGLQCENWTR